MKLLIRLLIGIMVGIVIGLFFPEFIVRIFITVKVIFGGFIDFIVPFIILFFIASGVSGLGKSSGKLLGGTLGLSYLSTIIAGFLAFIVARLILSSVTTSTGAVEEGTILEPFINIEILPLMDVVTALLIAFIFGIGLTKLKSDYLKGFFDEGKEIVERVISRIIIPFLPFYIAGIFAEMAYTGTVFKTLKLFAVVLILAIVMQWLWLVIQYTVAGAVAKRNPFSLLSNMAPAYFTAVGTMSSAATIPVALQSVKKNKVKTNIADFVVPLCATIHLSGSIITIITCTTAVMMITPELASPSLGLMIPVIFMLGVIMVAAPGVPGGAIMSAIGVLTTMLGFTEVTVGLMIALYMAQDSFGTAANVTGDGAIAVIVDRFSNK
ncbi:dicarboxylate/amino acid:cation symporter [bacterium LRH843]|nr:dicarboxylate/amino acid:cation symporter [bacterium LRH843]